MFFKKPQQDKKIYVEVPSPKINDTNKIKALQDKRNLYINDFININKNNLSHDFSNKFIFVLLILIISISLISLIISNILSFDRSLKFSISVSIFSLCLSLTVALLNNANMIDNRKYENIKKINDIQYELSLCAGYIIENDFIKINNDKQNIQIFLDNRTKELYVKN